MLIIDHLLSNVNVLYHQQVLGIENCHEVSDEGLSDCINGIDDMHFLSADRCQFIGAKVMQSLALKHYNLVDLFVNKCSLIDNDSLITVAKSCSKVKCKQIIH